MPKVSEERLREDPSLAGRVEFWREERIRLQSLRNEPPMGMDELREIVRRLYGPASAARAAGLSHSLLAAILSGRARITSKSARALRLAARHPVNLRKTHYRNPSPTQ